MKSPEIAESEGKKIDAFLDKPSSEGHARQMIETILFGDHRTLKEILKL